MNRLKNWKKPLKETLALFQNPCIEKIYSVSVLVGNGACNARCAFCAGEYLREESRTNRENAMFRKNLASALMLCARYGGWSLSITSSGEPTCDPEAVTEALTVYQECARQGAYFPNVNLFTNGIKFGDEAFCEAYLPRWKELGLTNVAVSIHHQDEEEQARVYGVREYPSLEQLIRNIEERGVGARATLLLRRGGIDNARKYEEAVDELIRKGFTNITSWPIGNPDATRNEHTPSHLGLLSIQYWLLRKTKKCHGHAWGGGVFDYHGNIVRYTTYVTEHDPRLDFVRQLVVFPDATVSYSWIREGALCMK